MEPEAELEQTGDGLVVATPGWFVLNARDARWRERPGNAVLPFEGRTDFPEVGINIWVLEPGVAIGMYHREAVQEDFLILSGEALLLVEEQERPLRAWDLVHCPAGTNHIIVGAGTGPCAVLAVGGRGYPEDEDWGRYTLSELARRHGVGVAEETSDAGVAYAGYAERTSTTYREGWLPDL